MCGICGIVGPADEHRLWAMANSLAHRGPDGAGVRCLQDADGTVVAGLGHRRLSIIDLTARGAQPMSYADERYWITYNGEVYNFQELRADLRHDGFTFASDTDTEVLLALYMRDGVDMLRRLNGIFAFAIWDALARELFLARDRLGVKPLYYTTSEDRFWFASEVKALLAGGVPAVLHRQAVADFLTFLWVPDPDTMFDGVKQLPAGHYGIYRDGRLTITQYWDMSFAVDEDVQEDLWPRALREAIGAAVRRQRVADVPVGSFLSGGIDSSAIVAELSRIAAPVTTYTVGFSAEDLQYDIIPDDVRYARQIAQAFSTDYHERILEADVVDLLPKLVWHMDDPIADPAAITTYLICREAREELTVILSGMGGDELFAGYPRHLAASLGRWTGRIPGSMRRAIREGIESTVTLGRPGRMRGPRRDLLKFVGGLDEPFLGRYLSYCAYYRAEELRHVLAPSLREEIGDHDPFAGHRRHLAKVKDEHWLNQLLYLDLKTFLPNLNLAYTDRMSMAASTEVRVPLIDDDVVVLSGRIPAHLKLRRRERKHVLKLSMESVLPAEVIRRPKAGFGAPLRSWLVGDLAPLVDDVLSNSAVAARGLLDPTEVDRIVAANRAGQEDNALRIWTMLNLELWQQTFLDGQPSPVAERPAVFGSPS